MLPLIRYKNSDIAIPSVDLDFPGKNRILRAQIVLALVRRSPLQHSNSSTPAPIYSLPAVLMAALFAVVL
jgi:hypothetical protein